VSFDEAIQIANIQQELAHLSMLDHWQLSSLD